MKNKSFAALIISHGRAENVATFKTLRKCGYTGKIFIVVDNEDDQLQTYKDKFGKHIIVFDKQKAFDKCDYADTNTDKRTALPARNICFNIAKKLNIEYFIELDDDYVDFRYRYFENKKLASTKIKSLDDLFDIMIEFLNSSDAKTVCFAQGGDFIGGIGSNVWKKQLSRKAMNAFLCKTNRPFDFLGRINEDVTAYTRLGQKGDLFFTLAGVTIQPIVTQTIAGGMSEVYEENGTYLKSFYSVMFSPSCVKIASLGNHGAKNEHRRIHHAVLWDRCTPMIISDKFKKKRK